MICQKETEWDLCVKQKQHNGIFLWWKEKPQCEEEPCRLTGVVKERVDKGAVFKEGADGGDVFKIAVEERRVNERDSFELHADEPEKWKYTWEGSKRTGTKIFLTAKVVRMCLFVNKSEWNKKDQNQYSRNKFVMLFVLVGNVSTAFWHYPQRNSNLKRSGLLQLCMKPWMKTRRKDFVYACLLMI